MALRTSGQRQEKCPRLWRPCCLYWLSNQPPKLIEGQIITPALYRPIISINDAMDHEPPLDQFMVAIHVPSRIGSGRFVVPTFNDMAPENLPQTIDTNQ
jgi:hypothetical protein